MLHQQVELHNADHVVQSGDGLRLCRVPDRVRKELNESARDVRAYNTCGCEIRFNLLGGEAKIVLRKAEGPAVTPAGVGEVYFGPFQAPYPLTPFAVGREPKEIVIRKPDNLEMLQALARQQKLPFDPELVRVILPYDWIYEIVSIEGDVEPPRPGQTPGLRLLSYGSSITHGGDAVRPTGTYAMRTARLLGADLINMGFAGSAHMDEALAEYIAGRGDWDCATVEMGINVIRIWEPETFARKVNRFLTVIAKRRPDRWLFCTDLFLCVHDVRRNPKVNAFRETVRTAVESLQSPQAIYIPGTELLTSVQGLSADLVHPAAAGHREIAERLAARIASSSRIFKQG